MGEIAEIQVKKCKECGEIKPLDDFYAAEGTVDGHMGKCKKCKNNYSKAYALTRSAIPRAPRSPEQLKKKVEVSKRWKQKNPEKNKAHKKLHKAIASGKLIRGTICEICGATGYMHAHHADYSKPLDVIWLCAKCHAGIR